MTINLKCLLSVMLCMFFVSQGPCLDARVGNLESNTDQIRGSIVELQGTLRDRHTEVGDRLSQLQAEVRRLADLTDSLLPNVVPIGAIIEYPGNAVLPANWLECDGRAVSRVDYAGLFGKIGITYGGADGINNFNLPDRRGRVAVGIDSHNSAGGRVTNATAPHIALGRTFGEERHQLSANELPSHQHYMRLYDGVPYDKAHPDNPSNIGSIPTLDYQFKKRSDVCHSQITEGALPLGQYNPHNNMQPSIFVKFYIRAR